MIPAVSWGLLPLAVSKLGGKPINQILGTTLGALLVALIVQAASGQSASGTVFLFCFISGAFWAFGQMLQYTAYTEIGVSKAMPLSTGMQPVSYTHLTYDKIEHIWTELCGHFRCSFSGAM